MKGIRRKSMDYLDRLEGSLLCWCLPRERGLSAKLVADVNKKRQLGQ